MEDTICFPPFFVAALITSFVSRHQAELGLVVPTAMYVYFPPFYSATVAVCNCFPILLRGLLPPSTVLLVFPAYFAVLGDRHNLRHVHSKNYTFSWINELVATETLVRSIRKVFQNRHPVFQVQTVTYSTGIKFCLANIGGISEYLNDVQCMHYVFIPL